MSTSSASTTYVNIRQELPLGGAIYGGDCMVVCNDWHSALVPMLSHAEQTPTGEPRIDGERPKDRGGVVNGSLHSDGQLRLLAISNKKGVLI